MKTNKMALTFKDDVAFHEAGHVIIGFLLSNILEIVHVTIDSSVSESHDPNSDGVYLIPKASFYIKLLRT